MKYLARFAVIPVIITASMSVLAPQISMAQGNLVFNGSFNGNALGWSLTGSTFYSSPGILVLDSATPSPSSDPSASQLITGLVPGTDYAISGDYRVAKYRDGGLPAEFSFGVALDGVYLFQAALAPPPPFGSEFTHFSFPYTAASSSALLSLAAQMNGSGQSYEIDNITMYAVPEPSTPLLFGAGCVMLRLLRPAKRDQR